MYIYIYIYVYIYIYIHTHIFIFIGPLALGVLDHSIVVLIEELSPRLIKDYMIVHQII